MIASALEESIEIFKAFDFLEASGNLMVIFTDGEDTTSIVHGRSLDDILKSAVDNKIPLFFVRTNYNKEFGEGIPDAKWQAAVEKTGGRYYVAKDEASLIAAVEDIDREAAGAISARQYTSQQPRFTMFALSRRCVVDRRRRFEGRHAVVWRLPYENCHHAIVDCRRPRRRARGSAGARRSWPRASPTRSRTSRRSTHDSSMRSTPQATLSDYLPGDRRRCPTTFASRKRPWRTGSAGTAR